MRSLRLPARSDSGLARLAPYLKGRWGYVAWMVLIATGGAAAQTGGWILVKLAIDRARFNPADLEMLEDMIVSAVRAAQDKASDMMRQEMEKAAGDLGLPPGLLPQ